MSQKLMPRYALVSSSRIDAARGVIPSDDAVKRVYLALAFGETRKADGIVTRPYPIGECHDAIAEYGKDKRVGAWLVMRGYNHRFDTNRFAKTYLAGHSMAMEGDKLIELTALGMKYDVILDESAEWGLQTQINFLRDPPPASLLQAEPKMIHRSVKLW